MRRSLKHCPSRTPSSSRDCSRPIPTRKGAFFNSNTRAAIVKYLGLQCACYRGESPLQSLPVVCRSEYSPSGGAMAHDAGAFRLEVGVFPIQRMTFASETRYQDGTLSIDSAALLAAIAEPRVITDLEIDLAHPGESCRLVHVLDTVAPMAKVQGRSTVYPGFSGQTVRAGDAQIHPLGGAAFFVCAPSPDPPGGALSPAEATFDMRAPAAPYCACSDTVNV